MTINRVEMSANLILDLLRIRSLNSSRFITCYSGKNEVLPAFRLNRLPHGISTLTLICNKDVFMAIVPPFSVEDTEYLDVIGHLNLIVSVNLPLWKRWIKLDQACFQNPDTHCADDHIAVEHEGLTC